MLQTFPTLKLQCPDDPVLIINVQLYEGLEFALVKLVNYLKICELSFQALALCCLFLKPFMNLFQ